ncbi:uncharacterized protein LOC124643726 isoform X2 [Helicoverpa zea]|uniref:uncharacterized protein LOC124643726 isoform X2 n=1 Tax=Helicoverpa zea TaxID=7113 RepID=UPI001F598EE0|nr:uncharacterized protein LOC124643726 isoform X2 [Helicoverpa zea]
MAFECVIVKEEPNLKEDGDNEVSSETASQNGADAEKNIIKVEIEVEAPTVRIKPEPLDPQPSTPPRSPSDPSWHAPCQEGSTVPATEEVTNILPEKYIQVSIKEEVDSDDITNASSTVEEHTKEGPDVGQTSAENIVMDIENKNAESMTSTSKALEPKRKRVDMDCGSKTQKKRKFRNEAWSPAILKSNLDFKKRQLAILEAEHSDKVEIQKLKIRKLQLEIAMLEWSTLNVKM